MTLDEIGFLDIILSIFYSILILLAAKWFRNRHKEERVYNFFIPFVAFKILCAVLFVIIHIYFYKGGDTFLFFAGGKFIANYLIDNPSEIFNLFRLNQSDFQAFTYKSDFGIINSFRDPTTLFISQVIAIFSFFSFHNFMTTTILFSVASSFGIWLMYLSACKIYPDLYKIFALCFLFIPSVGIWGSGILKDPVTFSAIGFIFYSILNFMTRRKIVLSVFLLVISIYFCIELKPYILYAFVPAAFIWIYFVITRNLKSPVFKVIFFPILLLTIGFGAYFLLIGISSEAGKYQLTNLDVILEGFQSWHTYLAETRDQSGYVFEDFELSPTGIIKQVPKALVVTYFRPFPTEIDNLGTLMGGVESLILLIATIYVFFKTGLFNMLNYIRKNPELKFFLFFSLVLGVAVGLTSYNFGALSRYKIPCMPFFTASLAIFYYLKQHGINGIKRQSIKQI